MPRPKNKAELLQISSGNYNRLFELIDSFTEADQEEEFPAGSLNRNIRDVLGHLHHWHLLLLSWREVAKTGGKPEMPAPGHSWKTTPALNREIHALYCNTPLREIKSKLEDSHRRLTTLIEEHSEVQLFEKRHFKWTGSTSLAAYIISATSSHYDWAYKLIKRSKSKN